MTYWIILGLSLALNGALGYWIYSLKKAAFAKLMEVPKSSEQINKEQNS